MRSINLKLFRDLVYMRGQAFAICTVMACGVATFVMSLSMLDSLKDTLDTYYDQNRFAHVFAHLKRAPESIRYRIAEIPGVAHAQTRVVERIKIIMPGLAEPASGKILSLPDTPDRGLNLIYLRAGRFPEQSDKREVLVSQRFAETHNINPGDTVDAVLNGRLEQLNAVGIALSPEYTYLIPPGSPIPDNRRYCIFWMNRNEMQSAFDMEGAFNDITLSLMPGANLKEVIERVDELTERYGGLGAYDREDQISNQFLQNELKELKGMALVIPAIFLGVSAFLFNIVLSRMIATQREQIAALKALGYSSHEIGTHYLSFVLMITLIAVIAGSAAGARMGVGLTRLYIEFFDFPTFLYTLDPSVILLGALVSIAAASIGVWSALRSAMKLPPAEAMRPKAPPSFKPTVLERIGFHRWLPPSGRMIVRQLERSPIKSLLSILGIALATAVMVVGSHVEDTVDYVLDFQFNRVMQHDVEAVMSERTDDTALSGIRDLPGVLSTEPYTSFAVRLTHENRSKRTAITGLTQSDGLQKLLNLDGSPVNLPADGIVLSNILGELLNINAGDLLRVESLEGRREVFDIHVAGFIDDFSGYAAYMNIDAVSRRMRERNTLSGVYLSVDEAHAEELYTRLREMPAVVAVNIKQATLENFRSTIARNLELMRPFLIGFATIIAFGVVYNSARISLSERARDLATLRVLGFTLGEVTSIQLGELLLLTGVGVPFGLVMGYYMAWYISIVTASELIRLPFVIDSSTFVFSAAVVISASCVSGLIVLRRLNRLDMVSVLKSRE